MNYKKLILLIGIFVCSGILNATGYPCFTAFQAEIARPALEYLMEQDCCPSNTWYHEESELSWNQSLNKAVDNHYDCCRDSNEPSC